MRWPSFFVDGELPFDRDDLEAAASEAYEIALQSGSEVLRIEACHAHYKLRHVVGDTASAQRFAEEAKAPRDESGYQRPSICFANTAV
jgi:hypothetical protein